MSTVTLLAVVADRSGGAKGELSSNQIVSTPLGLGGATSGGAGPDLLARVCPADERRIGCIRTVTCAEASNDEAVARLDRIARQTAAHQSVDTEQLDIPVFEIALAVLRYKEEPNMRIRPFDSNNSPCELDWPADVSFCRKRRM